MVLEVDNVLVIQKDNVLVQTTDNVLVLKRGNVFLALQKGSVLGLNREKQISYKDLDADKKGIHNPILSSSSLA